MESKVFRMPRSTSKVRCVGKPSSSTGCWPNNGTPSWISIVGSETIERNRGSTRLPILSRNGLRNRASVRCIDGLSSVGIRTATRRGPNALGNKFRSRLAFEQYRAGVAFHVVRFASLIETFRHGAHPL